MKYDYQLKYAPHIGLFPNSAGQDPIDQIKYMADLGFKVIEDGGFNADHIPFDTSSMGIGMCVQSSDTLDKIGNTLTQLGMEMGTFVLTPTHWPPIDLVTSGDQEKLNLFLEKCKRGVDVARRINAGYVTITLDCFDRSLPIEIQTANAINALRYAADLFEPVGVTMVIEPLSNHHELFLRSALQAYLICVAVNRDSCKILFDMFHLQKNEGNLIKNIDLTWDQIGYIQVGNVPDRFEPGTGEIQFKTIFQHIYDKSLQDGKQIIIGMEHYKSQDGIEGEQALIKAYQQADPIKSVAA